MAQVVIIGAGLTGLSAAYHLEKQGFFDYTLYEKESVPGGLCRSVKTQGFIFDYTGHLLHCNDPYVQAFLQTLSTGTPFVRATRSSHIYSYDTYTPYPYQQQLYGLPPAVIADCIEGFATRTKNKNPRSFISWVNTYFGSGLGKHFFFPYQQKLFAHDLEKITASWTGRFVPSTSLRQLIQNALTPQQNTPVGYNAQFFYPAAGGINQLIGALAGTLINPPLTKHAVREIDLAHKKIIFTSGTSEFYETLISTMPLSQLLNTLTGKPQAHTGSKATHAPTTLTAIKRAVHKLHCNSVININLGIAKPIEPRTHWIYYPEKQYPFYRIGFPSLLAPAMAPAGCSSLSIEISHMPQTQTAAHCTSPLTTDWQQSQIEHAITHAKKIFHLQDQDIIMHQILHLPHAYVIYDQWRDTHLEKILSTLAQHDIHSTGRYGAWKYSSMQEAILDGRQAAKIALASPGARTYYAATLQASAKKQTHP